MTRFFSGIIVAIIVVCIIFTVLLILLLFVTNIHTIHFMPGIFLISLSYVQ